MSKEFDQLPKNERWQNEYPLCDSVLNRRQTMLYSKLVEEHINLARSIMDKAIKGEMNLAVTEIPSINPKLPSDFIIYTKVPPPQSQ